MPSTKPTKKLEVLTYLDVTLKHETEDNYLLTDVAWFTPEYADKIVNVVDSGGGGGSGDVTQAQLNAEIQARKDGDATLTTNLNKEISDRESADTTLQSNIDKEANAREKDIMSIARQLASYNAVFKDVSTDSYPQLKNLKVTFKPGVMILQGDIYPLASASSIYALDPYQLFLGATWKLKLTEVLNSKAETLESIIKSYEVLTDFTKLQAYGGGEDNTVTLFNTTIPSGAGAVNGRFSCGCKYFYDTLTADKEIIFFVSYNLMKVDAEKKHTFDNEQLKKFFRCPFTLVIPLVTK